MALASAGKVPDRGRKFMIFGLFFVIFNLNSRRDPTKTMDNGPFNVGHEPRFKHQWARLTVLGILERFKLWSRFWVIW